MICVVKVGISSSLYSILGVGDMLNPVGFTICTHGESIPHMLESILHWLTLDLESTPSPRTCGHGDRISPAPEVGRFLFD